MDAKFTLRAGRAFASDLAHIALCRLLGCDKYTLRAGRCWRELATKNEKSYSPVLSIAQAIVGESVVFSFLLYSDRSHRKPPGLNMHLVLLHMVKALCNDGDHVVIGKTVIHGFAFPAIFYKLTGPKYLQLMRNGRLGHS